MSALQVLLVEDNLLNRILARDVLEQDGHQVIEASTVEEGWQRIQEAKPDVVLLDVQIPGGGGEALLHRIRQNEALASVPIVAVTASAMQGDRDHLLRSGFDGYLSKPIDTRTFAGEITALVRRGRGA